MLQYRLGLLVALWLSIGGSVVAQRGYQTQEPPLADPLPANPTEAPRTLPSGVIVTPLDGGDGSIRPTQAVLPSPTPLHGGTPNPSSAVDPPIPSVGVRVRVPALIRPGKPIVYRLYVENRSQAAAHHVTLKDTVPADATFVEAKPAPSEIGTDLVWKLGSLPPNTVREIVLTLQPKDKAGVVRNCARVSFEHGQCVQTEIVQAALQVRVNAPKNVVLYDAVPFKIEIVNPTKLDIMNIKVVQAMPEGLEFEKEIHLNARDPRSTPYLDNDAMNQRIWQLSRLPAGATKVLEFRAIVKSLGNLKAKTELVASGIGEEVEHLLNVTEVKLGIKASGPGDAVVHQPATYQVVLNNLGSAKLNNIRVTQKVPKDCRLLRISTGGQVFQDDVQWIVTGLEPGETHTLTMILSAQSPGKRVLPVSVRADRGLEQRAEPTTEFRGLSAVKWDAKLEPATIPENGQTSCTVSVENTGTAPATNVQLKVEIPENLLLADALPPFRRTPSGILFEPLTIQPGQVVNFQVKFTAKAKGAGRLLLELNADVLRAGGGLRKEKAVTVFGG